jgi:hypothetical protein
VTLLDGRTFRLDDPEDADLDVKGIFVEPPHDEPAATAALRWRYVPWAELRGVRFEHPADARHGVGGQGVGEVGQRP